MKSNFTRVSKLILMILLPGFLFAQVKDYNLLLHSGKFIPEANVNLVSKTSEVLKKNLFNGKYYIAIQFEAIPEQATKDRLANAGLQLIDYLPNYAYTAIVQENFNLSELKSAHARSVFALNNAQKSSPEVRTGMIPSHAKNAMGYADLSILTYEKMSVSQVQGMLNAMGAMILAEQPVFRTLTVRVAEANVGVIANLPFIQWVEPIAPPNQLENLPGRTLHRTSILNDGARNLKGDGINVGIWDGGPVSTAHLDFSPAGRVQIMQGSGVSDHGTHVAGTITGRGLVNPRARGMAPNANLFSWDFNGDVQSEMASGIPANNLLVSSHSYGFNFSGSCNLNNSLLVYNLTARNTDININNNPSHLHVHSAGNSGNACAGGFYTITGSGKPAKNNIVVADINATEGLAGSSSSGPVQDGRIKPEISAMGTSVFSTWIPNNAYATISGTSMATPGVSGTAAVLYQRYKQLSGGANPPSSLIKNIICNGAEDLGNPGPDYRFGYGRLNALKAVKFMEDNRYSVNSIANGAVVNIPITVPANTGMLKVMLTWNDPAGAANANPALVNDLDLTVINGPTTTLPWILDKNTPSAVATQGVDNYSNIEQVTIDNPASGSYTLRITGTSVPSGPQEYAITWSIEAPYIEVLFPNGGESLLPGQSEYITWDAVGTSGMQTVEFSLNNGTNWTIISNSVPSGTTRLNWSVPIANTSTALVRVSNGSLTDNSANFNILGIPAGFQVVAGGCTSGEVSFTWTAHPDATHYDIYKLNTTIGYFEIAASNITGTSHTLTGLTPGASMYFTIVSKNNSTNSVSGMSNAINGTVSSGGGVGTIGDITGNANICGVTMGVPYNIPPVTGATSYTWTAPPGAVIASGQNTNSITIDYVAGSSSGNVSVFASNGSCNSPTKTLAVNVSTTALNAPASGGNQTATTCPANPNPVLTATATVPAGQTIVWYNAPTGGSVVVNPTLSSVGTVTYHAAARNASGCESNTRTPVTLTINQMPVTTVSASGPTTFCQGGSVTLTANQGNSYSWSNGATTQAITVTATGTFTVTVDHGSGCLSTSSPVNVTVNTIPTTTITADGPTSFCQGEDVVLTATAGSSYAWSNGASTQSITVSNTGSFTVTVTHANGCISTSTATDVTVVPSPVVSLTASPYTKLHPGLTTTLSASVTPGGTYTYVWARNGNIVAGASGSTLLVTPSALGDYTVTATNAGGCSGTSNIRNISDSASKRLFVFPSPNSGSFQVSYYSPASTTHVLTIYDSKGARVYNRSFAITSPYQFMDVDMRIAQKGIYTIMLADKSGKKLATGRVAIQ